MSLELNITCMNGKEIKDNEPVEIIHNLYLGSKYASYNSEFLNRYHVNRQDCIFRDDFTYLNVYIKDSEDCEILSSFYYSLDFISEGLSNGSVLVTCGRCRSAATVAGFLMSRKHFSFEDTISLLKEKRPQITINNAFFEQLRCFYECNCNIRLAFQLYLANFFSGFQAILSTKPHSLSRALSPLSSRSSASLPVPDSCINSALPASNCRSLLFFSRKFPLASFSLSSVLDHRRFVPSDLFSPARPRLLQSSSIHPHPDDFFASGARSFDQFPDPLPVHTKRVSTVSTVSRMGPTGAKEASALSSRGNPSVWISSPAGNHQA
ncbi:uncharacterized protein [Blastocystis hominis]|uniref:Tyrosine-protein phosphatase domain-containing protein n=1 Tax=Blastocystis hominis TaxID=12968 RepID=D8M2F8_BLAHO|nr:uncharacterized protein [Blastocystis hominis]CBK22247.2 unnamed protein product [Blastocystis hominis]|eukprot:XP_012896295.1 uncharacterized protein [Blastocystis hominis]